jgi:hypothetical protein
MSMRWTAWLPRLQMVEACAQRGVPLFVHENWRWQRPIRELSRILKVGRRLVPLAWAVARLSP